MAGHRGAFERTRDQRLAENRRAVCSDCGQRMEMTSVGELPKHVARAAGAATWAECEGKPIVRRPRGRKWLPHKREKPRRTSRVVDEDYLAIVRTLPCCAAYLDGHRGEGGCDPHHVTHLGLGAKGDDTDAVPLQRTCHDDVHGGRGPFKDWTKARRESWLRAMIDQTRRQVAEIRARRRALTPEAF